MAKSELTLSEKTGLTVLFEKKNSLEKNV